MKFLVSFLLVISLIACGQEDTGQKPESSDQQSVKMDNPHGKKHLNYSIPEGWVKENPSSSMRVAQYKIPGKEGKDGEMAVINAYRFCDEF